MEIFKLFGSIFVDNEKANDSISKTDSKAQGLASHLMSGIKTAVKWGSAIAAGASVAGAAVFGVASKAAATTDRIDKLSQRLGMSREGFQKWEFVLSQSGSSMESLQSGMKVMVQRIADLENGTGKGAEALGKLGIKYEDIKGLSQEDVFKLIVDRFNQMEDGAYKAGLAQDIFSRSGQELLPLLNSNAGAVDEMMQKARDLGLVLSNDAVDAGVNFTDTMDQIKRSAGTLATRLGVMVMPYIQKFASWTTSNMHKIVAVFQYVGEVTGIVFKYMRLIIGDSVKILSNNIILPFIRWLGEVWEANGADISNITQQVWALIQQTIAIGLDLLKQVFDIFGKAITGDWQGVWEGIKKLTADLWNSLPGIFESTMNLILSIADLMMTQIIELIRTIFGDQVGDIFQTAWDSVKIIWESSKEALLAVWRAFTAVFKGEWGIAWEEVKNAFSVIWSGITSIFAEPFETIQQTLGTIIDGVGKWLNEKFGSIFAGVKSLFEAEKEAMLGVWRAFSAVLKGEWGQAWTELKNSFATVWSGVKTVFTEPFENAKGTLENLINEIGTWMNEKLEKVFAPAKKIIDKVGGWFYDLYDKVVGHSYIPDMVDEIGEATARLKETLNKPVKDSTDKAGSDFQAFGEYVVDETENTTTTVAERWSSILDTISSGIGDFIVNTTAAFVTGSASWQSVLSDFGSVVGSISKSIFADMAKDMVKNLVAQSTWLATTLTNIATAVTAFLGQAYAALTAFFWFLGPAAPIAAGGVIAAAMAAIAALGIKIAGSFGGGSGNVDNPGDIGDDTLGENDPSSTGGSGGTQIVNLTGKASDMLKDSLRPLRSLIDQKASVSEIQKDLRELLNYIKSGDLALGGSGVSVQSLSVTMGSPENPLDWILGLGRIAKSEADRWGGS